MPGQVLHILHRHPLLQQGGNRRHPERMRRQPRRQPGVFQPPFDQLAYPLRAQRLRRQRPAPAVARPEQRRILGLTNPFRLPPRLVNSGLAREASSLGNTPKTNLSTEDLKGDEIGIE